MDGKISEISVVEWIFTWLKNKNFAKSTKVNINYQASYEVQWHKPKRYPKLGKIVVLSVSVIIIYKMRRVELKNINEVMNQR